MRLLAACLFAIGAHPAIGRESSVERIDPGIRVSLIRLIADPEAFHGKKVFVSGFAFIEFENNNLCISREPASSKDCVWINYDDGPYQTDADHDRFLAAERKWVKYHRKVITVRGIFDAHGSGHLGGSSGEIGHITEVFSQSSEAQ
jgi:hypothetical protein